MNNPLKILQKNWQTIILATLLLTALVFAISAFLTPQYESHMGVLVIEKQPESRINALAAGRSAEYLANLFSHTIYSESFINDTLQAPWDIREKFSSVDYETRKKQWSEAIEIKKIKNTGILEIRVLDPSRQEAEKLVQAIAWNLSTNNEKYHGGGKNINVVILDGPLAGHGQARPHVFLNSFLALLIGFAGSWLFFLLAEKFGWKLDFSRTSVPDQKTEKNYFAAKPSEGETDFFPPQEELPVVSEEDYFASFSRKAAPPENLPTPLKKDELEKSDIFPEEKELIFPEATSEEVKARLNKLLGGKL